MKIVEVAQIQTKVIEIFENISFKLFIEEEYVAVDSLGLVWAFTDKPVPSFGMWEGEKQPRYLGQVSFEGDEKWYNLLFVA